MRAEAGRPGRAVEADGAYGRGTIGGLTSAGSGQS